MKLAILQPCIPHYREEFFQLLSQQLSHDVYVYNDTETVYKQAFKESEIPVKRIANKQFINRLLFYNPLPFLSNKYDTLVLMWHFGHVTTWLLLLTRFLHRKKIILWGQGISVKRYLKEEIKPNKLLWLQLSLANGAWVYMQKEQQQWKMIFPKKQIIALNNTISGIASLVAVSYTEREKANLKKELGFIQKRVIIFCARFDSLRKRRIDILQEIIRKSNTDIGFIIIGGGSFQPDFSWYKNVYVYGVLYEKEIKDILFSIADLYLQPAWLGLSVVEALAYGKPVITLQRSSSVLQCVEFSYIKDGYNGKIFEQTAQLIEFINTVDELEINRMGKNAKSFAQEKLSMVNMVKNAASISKYSKKN
jgi:glycosyltransferase involved in cell wall biosynthesis